MALHWGVWSSIAWHRYLKVMMNSASRITEGGHLRTLHSPSSTQGNTSHFMTKKNPLQFTVRAHDLHYYLFNFIYSSLRGVSSHPAYKCMRNTHDSPFSLRRSSVRAHLESPPRRTPFLSLSPDDFFAPLSLTVNLNWPDEKGVKARRKRGGRAQFNEQI